jgi:hypothetical protein
MYKFAVGRCGASLKFVPEEQRTPELCAIAVANCGFALEHVPEKHKTGALCWAAIGAPGPTALGFVPLALRNSALHRYALDRDPMALRFLPREERRQIDCLAAVSKCGAALQHVPEELIKKQMIERALFNDPLAIRYVPAAQLTVDLCVDAVRRNKRAAKFISEFYRQAVAERFADEEGTGEEGLAKSAPEPMDIDD